MSDQRLLADARAVRAAAHPLTGAADEYAPLLDLIGDARIVLLGEASHGTYEFYAERAALTRLLIEQRGFRAVAVEADWPDAYRVNCFVRGTGDDPDSAAALGNFTRFPAWMWRNTVVRDFVTWLRAHNAAVPDAHARVGFYGLDLYSLYSSIEAVLSYLDKVDPNAAQRARYRYGCFEHFGEDPQAYGYSASINLSQSCAEGALDQLHELQQRAEQYANRDGQRAEEEFFYAEQNARLAKNAEAYYRTMFEGRVSSWNLRDTHMADTLDALVAHLDRHGGPKSKVVVWAHNSHLGDARATELGQGGELNVGQLVRERYGDEAALIGFTTYSGTVTAARDWGGPAKHRRVRPGLNGSYEALLHAVNVPRFVLPLRSENEAVTILSSERLERAIGVIYRPETERLSHYFHVSLPDQFDAIIHIDRTSALEPLERSAHWQPEQEAETFPSGL